MIHVAESLAIHSIEGFLTRSETAELRAAMDAFVSADGIAPYDEDRTATMHEIPGHSAAEAMAVYEPAGRLEVTTLPPYAEDLLASATQRNMDSIVRALPSVTALRPWTYVEYGPEQHITPHVDGVAPHPHAWPRQIAGISLLIEHPEQGGDFYVETTGSQLLWSDDTAEVEGYAPSMSFAKDGADQSSPWFRDMPRTRWTVQAQPGDAVLYGSQLTHGTTPVVSGRARKFISWLIMAPAPTDAYDHQR